jgi:hypothetical protein
VASRSVTADRLLRCGAAAGPLFVTVFLVEGARRPGYNPLRHPVSSLSLGRHGWVQRANFAVAGTLLLAGAAGFLRMPAAGGGGRLGAATFAATGIGLLGSAVYSTDPVGDYPPGTLNAGLKSTSAGNLHNLAGVPIFVGIPVGSFICSLRSLRKGERAWALYSATTSVSMLATTGMSGAGFSQSPPFVNLAGLLQRIAIVTGFGWLTALCARAIAAAPRSTR